MGVSYKQKKIFYDEKNNSIVLGRSFVEKLSNYSTNLSFIRQIVIVRHCCWLLKCPQSFF